MYIYIYKHVRNIYDINDIHNIRIICMYIEYEKNVHMYIYIYIYM